MSISTNWDGSLWNCSLLEGLWNTHLIEDLGDVQRSSWHGLGDLNDSWASAIGGCLGNGNNIERDTIKASSIATVVGQNVLERWTKSLLDLGNIGCISNVSILH